MGQQHQIDWWQVRDLARRPDLAPGPDAMTQVGVRSGVHERRISQDREPAEADQRGGIADKVHLTLGEVGYPAVLKPHYGQRAPPCRIAAGESPRTSAQREGLTAVSLGPRTQDAPLRRVDGNVVDACFTPAHQSLLGK